MKKKKVGEIESVQAAVFEVETNYLSSKIGSNEGYAKAIRKELKKRGWEYHGPRATDS